MEATHGELGTVVAAGDDDGDGPHLPDVVLEAPVPSGFGRHGALIYLWNEQRR